VLYRLALRKRSTFTASLLIGLRQFRRITTPLALLAPRAFCLCKPILPSCRP
jgi:hypothetical protein